MLGIPDIFPPPQLYLVRGGPFRASPSSALEASLKNDELDGYLL